MKQPPDQETVRRQLEHWRKVKAQMLFGSSENEPEHVRNTRKLSESTQCAPGEAIRASGLVSLDDTGCEG